MMQSSSRSRRSSLDSPEYPPINSPASSVLTSPYSLSGFHSSSELVLLPDQDDQDLSDFSNDDEQEGCEPQLSMDIMKLPIPPLPAHAVFLYLLAPYLRVGAFLTANDIIPLKFGLFTLFLAATLSAFSCNIWFHLARYLRKSTAEDVFLEMLPKSTGRAKRKQRGIIRYLFLCATGLLRILTASMYLRASVDSVYPFVLEARPVKTGLIVIVGFGMLISVVSLSKSLAAKPVICATLLSLVLYTSWLVAALYNHVAGMPVSNSVWLQRGVLWNDSTSVAFSFATSLTVPLSASFAGRPSASLNKMSRRIYFPMMSLFSAALAALLILPSVLTASDPSAPGALVNARGILVHILRASSLLFAIPSVVVSTPPLPVPQAVRRVCKFDFSKVMLIFVVAFLGLAPPPNVAGILNDFTLLLSLAGTYFLPACAHIIIHYFRRPLSIVIPSHPPNTTHDSHTCPPQSTPDLLLQRKERLLQRKRLWRRILWDIGVWLLLIPVCVFGMIWAGGRLIGRW